MKAIFQRILAWFLGLFRRKPEAVKDEHFTIPVVSPEPTIPEKPPEAKRGLGIGHGMHRIKKILGRSVQPLTRAEKRLIERRTGVKIK